MHYPDWISMTKIPPFFSISEDSLLRFATSPLVNKNAVLTNQSPHQVDHLNAGLKTQSGTELLPIKKFYILQLN